MMNLLMNIGKLAVIELATLPWWIWVVAGVVVAGIIVVPTTVAAVKHKRKSKVGGEAKAEEKVALQEESEKEDGAEAEVELSDEAEEEEEVEESIEEETEEAAEEVQEAVIEAEEEAVEAVEEEVETEEVVETVVENTETTEVVVEEETEDEEEDEEVDSDEEEPEESGINFVDGFGIVVRYNKSYKARLIQSNDDLKNNYSAIKNELLSYKKVKSRTSWNYESLNAGRTKIAKFNVRGKTLKLYLALNPDDYADTKYKVERVEAKRYEEVPCLYRITNPRRLKYAMDLIADVAAKNELVKGNNANENFVMPYETTEELIEEGLIKELISQAVYDEYMRRKNQAEVDKIRREFVSAAEVNAMISDDVAVSLVEDVRKPEKVVKPTAGESIQVVSSAPTYKGKKGIINIDTLSANFEANEKVTLASLKEKKLITKNIGYVKVLARGVLNKPLEVELNDYSIEAVKMILLTGGKVKRV